MATPHVLCSLQVGQPLLERTHHPWILVRSVVVMVLLRVGATAETGEEVAQPAKKAYKGRVPRTAATVLTAFARVMRARVGTVSCVGGGHKVRVVQRLSSHTRDMRGRRWREWGREPW